MSESRPSRPVPLFAGLAALVMLLITALNRRRRKPTPSSSRQPGLFVQTEDGVPLAVEEDGSRDA